MLLALKVLCISLAVAYGIHAPYIIQLLSSVCALVLLPYLQASLRCFLMLFAIMYVSSIYPLYAIYWGCLLRDRRLPSVCATEFQHLLHPVNFTEDILLVHDYVTNLASDFTDSCFHTLGLHI